MTYRQRTLQVKGGLRNVRKRYRTLDSTLERLERELDRLIDRKTLVGAESLRGALSIWSEARKMWPTVEQALADIVTLASG